MPKLEDYTPEMLADQGAALGYEAYMDWYAELKQECFERRAAMMYATASAEVQAVLSDLLARCAGIASFRFMRASYTPLAALGVIRYGEAPYHWPESFTAEDAKRAVQMPSLLARGWGVAFKA